MKCYYIEYNQHNKTTPAASLEQVKSNFENIKSRLATKEFGNFIRIVEMDNILDFESSTKVIEEQYYQLDSDGNGYWDNPSEEFIYSFHNIFDIDSDYLFEVKTVYLLNQQDSSSGSLAIAAEKPNSFVNKLDLKSLLPFSSTSKNPSYFKSIQQLEAIGAKVKYSRWNHLQLNVNILSLIKDNITDRGIEYFLSSLFQFKIEDYYNMFSFDFEEKYIFFKFYYSLPHNQLFTSSLRSVKDGELILHKGEILLDGEVVLLENELNHLNEEGYFVTSSSNRGDFLDYFFAVDLSRIKNLEDSSNLLQKVKESLAPKIEQHKLKVQHQLTRLDSESIYSLVNIKD